MNTVDSTGPRDPEPATASRTSRLGPRVVRGGISVIGAQAIASGGTAVGMLVLASFVTPRQFGLVALAVVAVNAATNGLSVGMRQLPQAFEATTEFDRTALTFAIATGLIASGALFLGAPWVAHLLGDAAAAPYIRGLALVTLARRVAEVRAGTLERALRFQVTARLQSIATVGGLAVGFLLGAAGAGPWSLVALLVIADVLGASLLMSYPEGERRPGFDRLAMRRIRRFGREMAANSLAVFIYTNVDDVVVSRLAGTSQLGAYSFAFNLASAPTYAMTRATSRVLLPTMYTLLSLGEPAGDIFRRVVRALGFASGLSMFWIAIHAPNALSVVFSQRWASAYPVLRILAVYGLIRSVAGVSGSVFLAHGRPGLVRRVTQWQTLFMLAAIVPGVRFFGIEGAAVAVTVPLICGGVYALGVSGRMVDVQPEKLWASIAQAWALAFAINVTGVVTHLVGGAAGVIASVAWVGALGLAYARAVMPEEVRLLRASIKRHTGVPQESNADVA